MKPFSQVRHSSDIYSISSANSSYSQNDPSLQKRISNNFRKQIKESTNQRNSQIPIVKSMIKSAIGVRICQICTNNINNEEKVTIGIKCNHIFCFECLSQYCIYKINVNEEVYCPQDGCEEKLSVTSEMFHKLPEQIQQRFQKQSLWRQTIDNPNIKVCPAPQCEEGIVDMLFNPPQCRKCKKQFCKECMMPKHQGPCDSNFQRTFRQWKRCPRCKMFIQKSEGCNHMTCQCEHQFCFVCLSDWQSSHYNCIEGMDRRLCFDDTETMNSVAACFFYIVFLLFFPLIFLGLIVFIILTFIILIPVGAIVAPLALCKQMGLVFVVCFLCMAPFVILFGAIGIPIMAIITTVKPKAKRFVSQYCNTLDFLKFQICK